MNDGDTRPESVNIQTKKPLPFFEKTRYFTTKLKFIYWAIVWRKSYFAHYNEILCLPFANIEW